MLPKESLPEINPNRMMAVDLETCDPELKFTGPGYISGVGFIAGIAIAVCNSTKDEIAAWRKDTENKIELDIDTWYIPVGHADGENYALEDVVEWLNKILSGNSIKIFHNAQYDVGWLWHNGIQIHGEICDTMLMAPLLDENRFSYELDSLGREYMNEGKFEEALAMAVEEKFREVKTRKVIIRLKEDRVSQKVAGFQPFIEAKARTSQFYDLWPKEVQDKYTVLGHETDKKGKIEFKVPTKRKADIKSLLWAVDPEEMGSYPMQDVELTLKLFLKFNKMIHDEELSELAKLEYELIMPLLEMRIHGVRIDMDKAVDLYEAYTRDVDKLQEKLNKLCGFPVDVNIDDDLIKICTKFNLEYAKTPKGNPCFASDKVPKDKYGIFDTILQIRKYFKARDTYLKGYMFGSTFNGWLHGQYNQLKSDEGGTVTGRLSSSNPNMQNMPNPKKSSFGVDIRSLFLPDNEDEDWLSMDYSGQEPKMLVHTVIQLDDRGRRGVSVSTTEEYIPGASLARTPEFSGREADFHTAVATICMREELKVLNKKVTDEELKARAKAFRPKAKSIGLGVMYGSGNKKVAEEMTRQGHPMTTDEAAEIRENIYKGVPFLNEINQRMIRSAKEKGYIETILGRRGHFPLWECRCWDKELQQELGTQNMNFKDRALAYLWYDKFKEEHPDRAKDINEPQRAYTYKALNKYIQGSSADQTKTAMLHLYKRNQLDTNVLDIFYRRIPGFAPPKFKTQVHDEINISKPKGESAQWYQDIMEHCIPLKVEVVADPVVCTRWSEAK